MIDAILMMKNTTEYCKLYHQNEDEYRSCKFDLVRIVVNMLQELKHFMICLRMILESRELIQNV